MHLLSSPGTDTATRTRRRLAVLLSAALVVAPLMVAGSITPASATFTSVPGGPVVLDGNDPADHVAQTTSYIRRVYASLDARVAAGYVNNGQVAVIGSCKAMLDSMATGETFVQFNSAAEVSGLFDNIATNTYRHVHICSDEDSTLSVPVQAELDKWGSAIVTHVNRGGGLFSTGHGYRWLNNLFPSLVTTAGGTASSYVTTDGAILLGLAADTPVNAVNHYTFTGEGSTPLKPLLTANTGGGGNRVAIGGTVVRFLQILIDGPAMSPVGATETYALSAATADGLPLASSAFTYTITGPTTAVTSTGTGVTDASGNYTFSFAGNARGTTEIRVLFNFAGTAAGSSSSTTWVSLASAPNPLTAATTLPGSVQLAWAAPSSPGLTAVTDYLLQRSADGVTWTTITDGTSTATSYVVNGLVPTTSYTFRVAAVNGDGPGAWSNLASNIASSNITFPALSDTEIAAGSAELAATASSGLPVAFSSITPGVCTVSGGTVTLVRVGTCSVAANQDGNARYEPAATSTRSFEVLPSASQVRFPAIDDRLMSTSTMLLTGRATSGLALTFTSNTPAVCTVSGNVVTPVKVGICSVTASQDGDVSWIAAEAVTRTFRLLANDSALGTVTSTGSGPDAQTVTIPVPPGGVITLIDGAGNPATTVTVPGEGTYALDPASGTVTFTPAPGFAGVGTGVVFRVTDTVGQVSTGRFAPSASASAGVRLGAAPGVMVPQGRATVPASCTLVGVNVASCTVQVFATVAGKKVLLGTGTVTYPVGAEPGRAVPVIRLNALGRKLVRSVGGRAVSVEATVVPAGGAAAQQAITTSRMLPRVLRLHRPVFFSSSSAELRPAAKKYLKRLRARLGSVRTVTCTGYADSDGAGKANVVLGKARAKAVCRALTRGLTVSRRLLTQGEQANFGDNSTRRGKAANRRTMITLRY